VDTEEFDALDPLHYTPLNMLGPLFPAFHDQLLCLADVEGEIAALAPHCQVSDVIPMGS
jgi:hypothetical protein